MPRQTRVKKLEHLVRHTSMWEIIREHMNARYIIREQKEAVNEKTYALQEEKQCWQK